MNTRTDHGFPGKSTVLGASVLLGALIWLAGCSVLLDTTECVVEQDCVRFTGEGQIATCINNTCVIRDETMTPECTKRRTKTRQKASLRCPILSRKKRLRSPSHARPCSPCEHLLVDFSHLVW